MTVLRIVDKPTWMRPENIEFRAESLLNKFALERGITVRSPIPVTRIIEDYLDLSIDWGRIPEQPSETILAYILPESREIRMNESHVNHFDTFIGSELFTLAHEVGHWVLHVETDEAIQLALFSPGLPKRFICRRQEGNKPDSFEWQANRFAAALTMPEALVRYHTRGVNICAWRTIEDLKDVFGVTVSALKNRLVTMGLLYVSADGKLYPSAEECYGQQKLCRLFFCSGSCVDISTQRSTCLPLPVSPGTCAIDTTRGNAGYCRNPFSYGGIHGIYG